MIDQLSRDARDQVTERDLSWRAGLPTLSDASVTLRELRPADALPLLKHLNTPSVQRFIARPPRTAACFGRFIRWTQRERRAGRHLCFGVFPAGQAEPVGLVQIWSIEADFATAEWGFAIGESAWGTGAFGASARLLLEFAFDTLGVQRLETRAVDANERGSAALRKLGFVPEGILRRAFRNEHTCADYVMWSLLAEEWGERR